MPGQRLHSTAEHRQRHTQTLQRPGHTNTAQAPLSAAWMLGYADQARSAAVEHACVLKDPTWPPENLSKCCARMSSPLGSICMICRPCKAADPGALSLSSESEKPWNLQLPMSRKVRDRSLSSSAGVSAMDLGRASCAALPAELEAAICCTPRPAWPHPSTDVQHDSPNDGQLLWICARHPAWLCQALPGVLSWPQHS